MNKILLIGGSGQVGWELQRSLAPLGTLVVRPHSSLDLTQDAAIRQTIRETRPDIVVNAAAYTAVDQAEQEADLAMVINGRAPAIMAEEARAIDALLVHYSTDYVFDGTKASPYLEDDPPNPLSVYGKTKLAGERAIVEQSCRHLIFRTSWVYGLHGKNFLRTMQRLGRERNELKVVADQFGAPTWSRMIAETTALALRGAAADGVYHLPCAGSTTWHGFAAAILAAQNWQGRLLPIPASEYPLPARRPANSRLDHSKLQRQLRLSPPDWETALALCLADDAAPR